MRSGKHRKIILKRQRSPGAGQPLDWVWCRSGDPRAVVYLPPLIGGNLSQQIRYFRPLLRHGYDLVSFTYTGHGMSGGRFSLSDSLKDAMAVLDRVIEPARKAGLPLFGVGCCYSAIPLLYSAARCSEPFGKIVLINAVTRIDPLPVLGSFVTYYRELMTRRRSLPRISEAVRSYMELLFPGVIKSRRAFGVLDYRRLRPLKLLQEIFGFSPLADKCLENTNTLCLYSKRDPVLDIFSSVSVAKYRQDIRSICPGADFRAIETDHFFSHPLARQQVRGDLISFFNTTGA